MVPFSPGILLQDRIIGTVIVAAVGIAVAVCAGSLVLFRERTTPGPAEGARLT